MKINPRFGPMDGIAGAIGRVAQKRPAAAPAPVQQEWQAPTLRDVSDDPDLLQKFQVMLNHVLNEAPEQLFGLHDTVRLAKAVTHLIGQY